MYANFRRIASLVLVMSMCASAAADGVTLRDIAGWWAANPEWGGETSHVALQFVEKDGKAEGRVSLPAIGAYDVPLGEVTFSGNDLDTKPLAFPLTWNPEKKTLSGFLTAEAVPVYRIPVVFARAEPFVKPPAKEWRAPPPRVRWRVATDGSAIWAGLERDADTGTLYVGNENGVLQAIGPDGRLRWTFATGKPIRAQPRVIGAHVYVHSDSGFVHKLDAAGTEIWRARVDQGSEPRIPTNATGTRWDRYGSSVISDGQRLFVASRDKHLYALDPDTGRERWRVAVGDIMTATPALYRDSVIYAAFDGQVRALSAADGTPRWTYDAKLPVAGDLTVSGDRVLVGSRTYDLIALDAATGRELWKRYYWFSWIESPPVVRDGVVYTGSSDATNVYAIDLVTGAFRWKTPVPGWAWARTAVSDDLIVAGTVGAGAYPGPRAGSLVALDHTGAIRWMHLDPPSEEMAKAGTAWGFGAAPLIADGVVYAADLDGVVWAFELPAPAPTSSR